MRPQDTGNEADAMTVRITHPMSDLNIGINSRQRDLLLRGLRFIRSSVLLEVRDPAENETELRDEKLREIEDLVEQLNGAQTAGV